MAILYHAKTLMLLTLDDQFFLYLKILMVFVLFGCHIFSIEDEQVFPKRKNQP